MLPVLGSGRNQVLPAPSPGLTRDMGTTMPKAAQGLTTPATTASIYRTATAATAAAVVSGLTLTPPPAPPPVVVEWEMVPGSDMVLLDCRHEAACRATGNMRRYGARYLVEAETVVSVGGSALPVRLFLTPLSAPDMLVGADTALGRALVKGGAL